MFIDSDKYTKNQGVYMLCREAKMFVISGTFTAFHVIHCRYITFSAFLYTNIDIMYYRNLQSDESSYKSRV